MSGKELKGSTNVLFVVTQMCQVDIDTSEKTVRKIASHPPSLLPFSNSYLSI